MKTTSPALQGRREINFSPLETVAAYSVGFEIIE